MDQALSFLNPYRHGFARVSVAVPRMRVADPVFNAAETVALLSQAAKQGAVLVAFPELGLSAYTCDDLFHQRALLDGCEAALGSVAEATATIPVVAIVGLPLRVDHRLFNCAAVVAGGRVLGVVPKTYLPNYGEFYEARQFNGADTALATSVRLLGSRRAVRRRPDLRGGRPAAAEDRTSRSARTSGCRSRRRAMRRWPARRCWSTSRPRTSRSASRTTGIASSACSRRAAWRRTSTRRPGIGESTTDLGWDGQALIYESGDLLAEIGALRQRLAPHHRRRRPGARLARTHAAELASARRSRSTRRGCRAFARCRSSCRCRPRSRSRCSAASSAFRTCRPTPAGATSAARGLQHPGAGAGAAARGDRHPEAGDRRLGRARLDARAAGLRAGDGPARAAAHQHPRPTRCPASRPATRTLEQAQRLMEAVGCSAAGDRHPAELPADAGRHRPSVCATASRSTTSPSRTCRPASAPAICSAWPTSTTASSSAPAT